jgi:hypothetical protein
LKATTEKHPLPSIGDFLIAKPGASLSFICFGIVTQTDQVWRKLTVCVTEKRPPVFACTWRPHYSTKRKLL